jgi:hypothetical protein
MKLSQKNKQDWERNLLSALENLADIEMQKKAWLGLDPNNVSSFDEIIMILYDDFNFEGYIDYYNSLTGTSKTLAKQFADLNSLINNYHSEGTDIDVLSDTKWIEITNRAKEIVELFKRSNNR